jgi:hypothetical protein
MAKSSKYKQHAKLYSTSVLTGGVVLLALIALASTAHHLLTLVSITFLIGISIYSIWRMK